MYKESDLIAAIKASYDMYRKHGARSTKKLHSLHSYVAGMMSNIWGSEYSIKYDNGNGGSESHVDGKYFQKYIDITVEKDQEPIFCVGVKFITGNYKQNANNYIENMMGETANIQANRIPYAQFIILRYRIPYYKKNETEKVDHWEVVSKADIEKYLKLVFDVDQAHKPRKLTIQLVDIDEANGTVSAADLTKAFGAEYAKLIEKELSPSVFFEDISTYKIFWESTQT